MKNLFTLLILFFSYNLLYSQITQSNISSIEKELKEEKTQSQIILPEVKLRIEDESEIKLTKETNQLLEELSPKFEKIDIEELSKSKISEKFKITIEEQRKKEDFSLSSLRVFYGSFDNLLIEANIGKKIQSINYLITYLRNKRGILFHNTNYYYNTELDIDDLNIDFIYLPIKEIELNSSIGYYTRSIGLFQSPNLTEYKRNIPFQLNFNYNIDLYSSIKLGLKYEYLNLSHKLIGGYDSKGLSEFIANLVYDANWGKDNFLKLIGKYTFSYYDNDLIHNINFQILDRFPIYSYMSIEAGTELYYSYITNTINTNIAQNNTFTINNLFDILFPVVNFFVNYKIENILLLRAGFGGQYSPYSQQYLLTENQIDYNYCNSEKKWFFLTGIVYQPFNILKLKNLLSYNYYFSLINFNYNNLKDLYYHESKTNIQTFESELQAELTFFDNFIFSLSYNYKLPINNPFLLFYPQNYFSALLSYKNDDIGLDISTRFIYQDIRYYLPDNTNTFLSPIFSWEMSISYNIVKDISIELTARNILNQQLIEKPMIPVGGFGINGGIKISL